MVIGLLLLLFKFARVVFLIISLEFMVLSTVLYLVLGGVNFFLLIFIFVSVIASTLILIFLVNLVKCYGEDLCFFSSGILTSCWLLSWSFSLILWVN